MVEGEGSSDQSTLCFLSFDLGLFARMTTQWERDQVVKEGRMTHQRFSIMECLLAHLVSRVLRPVGLPRISAVNYILSATTYSKCTKNISIREVLRVDWQGRFVQKSHRKYCDVVRFGKRKLMPNRVKSSLSHSLLFLCLCCLVVLQCTCRPIPPTTYFNSANFMVNALQSTCQLLAVF